MGAFKWPEPHDGGISRRKAALRALIESQRKMLDEAEKLLETETDTPLSYFKRLVSDGFNPMKAALFSMRLGDLKAPISPIEMFGAGEKWADSDDRECPISSIAVRVACDGEITAAERRAWLVEALRLIYPAWAIPEGLTR